MKNVMIVSGIFLLSALMFMPLYGEDQAKEAACKELEKHKEYWKGRVDLDPAKLTRLQLSCDPCQALIEHEAYWEEHGGIDKDPLKRELLKGKCNPCAALLEHDTYWQTHGGIDLDPAKRILLNELCHPGSIERSIGDIINKTVVLGDSIFRMLKKYNLDVIHAISKPLREKIKQDFYLRETDPHVTDIAYVRVSDDPVCKEERAQRAARFVTVKAAQEKFLGIELSDDEVLDISFSLSGGGVRASLYGLGSLVGANKIGLLDCVMTINALSGGTWVLFPWIASGKDITTYREILLSKWEHGYPKPSVNEVKYIVDDALLVPFAFENDVTPTDLYGAALNNVLFSEFGAKRQRVKMTNLAGKTSYPIPVGEAAWAGLSTELGDEEIFEFTPYEMGSRWLKAYIPAWGVGRKYYRGVSINSAPENSIPLGIFGSAYAVRLSVIADTISNKVPHVIRVFLDKIMDTKIGELHALFAILHNYTEGMAHSTLKNEHDLPLSDSGGGEILQIMPITGAYRGEVSHIHPDILFAFDSGANAPLNDLPIMESLAHKMNLPLPRVTGKDVGEQFYSVATIFEEYTAAGTLDLKKPVFIYYPRSSDKELLSNYKDKPDFAHYQTILHNFDIQSCLDSDDCSTFSFNWPRARAEQVATLAEFNIIASEEKIQEVMREIVHAKRAAKNG